VKDDRALEDPRQPTLKPQQVTAHEAGFCPKQPVEAAKEVPDENRDRDVC